MLILLSFSLKVVSCSRLKKQSAKKRREFRKKPKSLLVDRFPTQPHGVIFF